ncbi:MAG: DUF2817 domain-containing protein [Methylomicrobium sp.]
MMPSPYDIETFSADYFEAREKFLAACSARFGACKRFEHPTQRYRGKELTTDVCWVGDRQADKVLVVISATHGVEGFCGSAAQIDWLRHGAMPGDDTAVLLIHALNPFGFAHLRRVNEDNVDLNRNFIDFAAIPINEGYRELAGVLLPAAWNEASEASVRQKLADYRQRYGQRKTEQAVSSGQYEFSDGLFYGGSGPSWSRSVIETICRDYALHARRSVAVVDIHSGLGPYGYGEVISDHPAGSKGAELAKRWFGDSVTEPALGTSTSVPKFGLLDYAWHRILADSGCYITLEFGTYSIDAMFDVLREENYRWHRQTDIKYGDDTIRRKIRDYFFPDKQDWKEMVLFRAEQVLRQALHGLASGVPND